MVLSIREANRREEEKRRIQRLEAARKHGANLGVLTARTYQVAKADQRKAVAEDLEKEWRKEIGRNQTQRNVLVQYAEAESGSAHRLAEEVMVSRTAQAAVEKEAWDAERRLGKMRAVVGHQSDNVEKEMAAAWEAEVNAHRARTRVQEMQRSQDLVRRRRAEEEAATKQALIALNSNNPLVPRSQAEIQADANRPKVQMHQRDGGRAAVTFALPSEKASDPEYVPPAVAAEKVRADTKDTQRVLAKKTREAQDKAQHNAALRATLEKEEKEREVREKQNIRNVLAAAATEASVAATASQRDFQSEEMRRSEMMNRKAHQEFEYTFLQLQNGTAAAAQAAALERRRQARDAFVHMDPVSQHIVVAPTNPTAYNYHVDPRTRMRRQQEVDDINHAADEWWNPSGQSKEDRSDTHYSGGPAARLRTLATDQIRTNAFPEPKKEK